MTTDTIVAGVHAHTAVAVLSTAARFAARLPARLVVVQVDDSRIPADPDDVSGRGGTAPLDPDEYDDVAVDVDTSALEAAAARLRTDAQITVEVRVLAGDPAKALARVAADTHAVTIAVGSSNGLAAGLHLHGSTVSFLMHHQPVPVLVVPVSKARP